MGQRRRSRQDAWRRHRADIAVRRGGGQQATDRTTTAKYASAVVVTHRQQHSSLQDRITDLYTFIHLAP